jgi:hypothetical protein
MSPAIHMKFAIQVLPIYLSRVEPGAYCSNLVERTSMIGLCKLSLSALALGLAPYKAHAGDKSGIHAFFNERQEPVRRLLAEQQQQGQIKVSDGRPWRPMWVMLHTASCLELRFWEEDYHVYCASPTPGRSGHVGSEVCPGADCIYRAHRLAASLRLGMSIQRAVAWPSFCLAPRAASIIFREIASCWIRRWSRSSLLRVM